MILVCKSAFYQSSKPALFSGFTSRTKASNIKGIKSNTWQWTRDHSGKILRLITRQRQANNQVNNLNKQAQKIKSLLTFLLKHNDKGHVSRSTSIYPCTTTTTSTDTSEQGKQNEKTEWYDECTLMHPMKPDDITIPDNNITKPANHSTREVKTQRREILLVCLPLGGGKLRCSDVLGLGSGRGSCLNPGGKGDQGIGRRWSKGKWLDKPFLQGLKRARGMCSELVCDVSETCGIVSSISRFMAFFSAIKENKSWWPIKQWLQTHMEHTSVRRSVSHYDFLAYGELKDPNTWSESFQHMVNLVLNHNPCQVKPVQCYYHSTPFYRTFDLRQMQTASVPCCCGEPRLITIFQKFHVFNRKSKGCSTHLSGDTLETPLFGHFNSTFKYDLFFNSGKVLISVWGLTTVIIPLFLHCLHWTRSWSQCALIPLK